MNLWLVTQRTQSPTNRRKDMLREFATIAATGEEAIDAAKEQTSNPDGEWSARDLGRAALIVGSHTVPRK